MHRTWFQGCTLALGLIAFAPPVRADFWLAPAGPHVPSGLAAKLTRCGATADLPAVSAGLNGAFAMRGSTRVVDLESGLVRALGDGAAQAVRFAEEGRLRSLAELVAEPDALVILHDDPSIGWAVRAVMPDCTERSYPLTPDQRALLGVQPCTAGYAPISAFSGSRCADIDECATDGHDCDENARCDNTEGGFVCTCMPGYEGDGKDCSAAPTGGTGGDSAGGTDEPPERDGGVSTGDRDAGRDEEEQQSGTRDGDGCGCGVVAPARAVALLHPVVFVLLWLRRRALLR